jgi:uncharacterized membrane protein
MDSYILDWLYMLLRWLHVIAAIAWIGASFYFVWLDNSLEPPTTDDLQKKGVDGELWAVHGGGFYNPQKYLTAPRELPEKLHWFYWESYTTWMSGFALFVLVYLLNAGVYLVDTKHFAMTPAQGVMAALGFLVGGWLVYDLLCRALGFRHKRLGLAICAFVVLATLAACRIFPGRAAFLIVGAMMATMMSANVLFWIIPGQRKVTTAMREGRPVDPLHGMRGKQRSVHNTYLTLPVLFCMLSNHFSLMYQHPANALVLVAMMLAGVLIRQFFLLRHKGQVSLWLPASGVAVMAGVFLWIQPTRAVPQAVAAGVAALDGSVDGKAAFAIIRERCHGCHATTPELMGGGPPKGIAFEALEDLERLAEPVYSQTVLLKAMPLGNITNMTDGERQVIARWFAGRSG